MPYQQRQPHFNRTSANNLGQPARTHFSLQENHEVVEAEDIMTRDREQATTLLRTVTERDSKITELYEKL